jgi:hypothetical protein
MQACSAPFLAGAYDVGILRNWLEDQVENKTRKSLLTGFAETVTAKSERETQAQIEDEKTWISPGLPVSGIGKSAASARNCATSAV